MVPSQSRSRWTATPLLCLLLSTSVQAQYTLRGRVTHDYDDDRRSVARRQESAPAAEPSTSSAPLKGQEDEPKGGEGDDVKPTEGEQEDKFGGEQNDDSKGGAGGDGGSKALYLNSHEDFCVYGPAEAGTTVAHAGDNVVAWCTQDHGGKTIPEGTFTGVTYVKTPNYVQVSGYGSFTGLNIAADDLGGQFDSSEHTPSGAQLLLGADKTPAKDWVTLIGGDTFCVRACTGDPQYCPTQYDELGCWFLTNDGVGWPNYFQDCEGEDGNVPGVFGGETFTPGQGDIPALTAAAVSNCHEGGGPGGAAATSPSKSGEHGSTSSGGASGSASSHGSSISGSSSASWVPVETCVPCAGAGSASASGSGSASATAALSGTTEVGMSQLKTAGTLAGSGSGVIVAPTTAPKASGDALVQKRQETEGGDAAKDEEKEGGSEGGGDAAMDEEKEGGSEKGGETVTKGDQCCFTTWTSQAAGGAGAAKPTGTGTGLAGAASTSAHPYDSMTGIAPSKSLNGTGPAGVNKTTGAANATGNDTDSGAGSLHGDAFGVDGISRIVVALAVGLVGGGWMLV